MAKLAFTGSSEVGRLAPFADIDAIVDNVTFASMYCNGQSCLAGTRLFLHDAIYDDFMLRLTTSMQWIKVADPTNPFPLLGCAVWERRGRRVQSYIVIGRQQASLATGGNRVEVAGCNAGWFFDSTVFETTNDSRLAQEEIFGPVVSVIRWSDYERLIHDANNVRYGLAAGLYTNDLKAA